MGAKISAVHGVKSDHFYDQGNAINEIWVDGVEIISRLPFGDSDQEQAGWPKGEWPKIPWHQFIIPMRKRQDCSMCECGSVLGLSGPPAVAPWLLTHGYLGMYTGLDWTTAYALGCLFLTAGFGFYLGFIAKVVNAFDSVQAYHAMPTWQQDLPFINTTYRRIFTQLLKCAILSLLFSAFFFALGLPAAVASMQRFNAGIFILEHMGGFCIGLLIVGIIAFPCLMYWSRRRYSDVGNETEKAVSHADLIQALGPVIFGDMKASDVDLILLQKVTEALMTNNYGLVIITARGRTM
jgi:hypothetical protein